MWLGYMMMISYKNSPSVLFVETTSMAWWTSLLKFLGWCGARKLLAHTHPLAESIDFLWLSPSQVTYGGMTKARAKDLSLWFLNSPLLSKARDQFIDFLWYVLIDDMISTNKVYQMTSYSIFLKHQYGACLSTIIKVTWFLKLGIWLTTCILFW